jgi:hypothetical protein
MPSPSAASCVVVEPSAMKAGAVRGCSETTSWTIVFSTGSMTGLSVLPSGSNSQALYSGGAAVMVVSARLSAVQGTTVPVVASRRHCDQLTRMRLELSQSGKAELKRPPGEGSGAAGSVAATVRTSLGVAGVCAGPVSGLPAFSGCVFST